MTPRAIAAKVWEMQKRARLAEVRRKATQYRFNEISRKYHAAKASLESANLRASTANRLLEEVTNECGRKNAKSAATVEQGPALGAGSASAENATRFAEKNQGTTAPMVS